MNITNLYKGQTLKNYKELCITLDIPIKTGEAKIKQLNELQRHIQYIKKGNAYIIDDIYTMPLAPKMDHRNIYKQHIQLIILEYLSKNKQIELTKNEILLLTGCCSRDYINKEFTLLIQELNNQYEITKKKITFNINDFYRRTSLKFTEIIDSAILSLSKNYCYIVSHKVYKIHKNGVNWIANVEEEQMIIDAKREVLNKMGMKNIQQVHRTFKVNPFYNEVNKLLYKNYGWNKCYAVYKINATDKINENLKHFMINVYDERLKLNEKVINYFNDDAKNKFNKNLNDRIKQDEEVWEIILNDKDTTIKDIFKISNDYVNIQKMISKYLLEI